MTASCHVPDVLGVSWCGNGEGGIRTHGHPKASPVFETGPFSRSGTSPGGLAVGTAGQRES